MQTSWYLCVRYAKPWPYFDIRSCLQSGHANYFICLPDMRPTSSRRIGPDFSHNTEYRHANTDLLFRLIFIHCAMVSPFILPCLPFSLTGKQKGERNHWRSVDVCMAFTYYIMLMAKCTCAWLHHLFKLLPSTLLSCTDSSHQDGFMLKLICMFLRCDMPIQLVLSRE